MPKAISDLQIAIVHYWLVAQRGGERVVEAIAEMYPRADIFTLVVDRTSLGASLQSHKITSSFLQKIPGARHHYQKFLPLFPLALEHFRLDDYDLVISSESGPAKGVLTSQHTCHICYCHSPMRYLWDMHHQYRTNSGMGKFSRALFSLSAHYVRMWDVAAASRVDYFIANSKNVASRIRKHYRREAEVIYPPVNISAGYLSEKIQDYYLVVSQLVGYKRVDLAIEACNRLKRPLRIIGDGKEYPRLHRLAGPTIEFLGFLPDQALGEHYAHCRALLFPGEEDFGIVPVEAQSYGRPVIAYGRGGVLETVNGLSPGDTLAAGRATGVFFPKQTVESVMEAILRFESTENDFRPEGIRDQVQQFDTSRFHAEMKNFINAKWSGFND